MDIQANSRIISPKDDAAGVVVAIEKRPVAKEVRATIYVSSVELEIIE